MYVHSLPWNRLLFQKNPTHPQNSPMGWRRSVGSIKSRVSFAEYRLFYRALLQKRRVILSILLREATLYLCAQKRFCGCIGRFWNSKTFHERLCTYIGLFCGYIGLFCGCALPIRTKTETIHQKSRQKSPMYVHSLSCNVFLFQMSRTIHKRAHISATKPWNKPLKEPQVCTQSLMQRLPISKEAYKCNTYKILTSHVWMPNVSHFSTGKKKKRDYVSRRHMV